MPKGVFVIAHVRNLGRRNFSILIQTMLVYCLQL